ncbi:MAG TPA: hypothetical protein VJZ71_08195 [Phycisphaerae bacterium]|nr:hypothetical protein [Phycisphaerae bacterium]
MSYSKPQETMSATGLDVTITIGADGRMYFHDLTPELVPIAAAICPNNAEVMARQVAIKESERNNA